MRPLTHLVCLLCLILSAALLSSCQGLESPSGDQTAVVTPANVIEVTTVADFDQRIAQSATPVVVDCYATWCGPCSLLTPELDAVAAAHLKTLTVLRVDVDRLPELAQRYQADTIPLLLLFRHGTLVSQQTGYQNRTQIASWLGL